ncbi:MAG: site-specific DNA-methyltransferase [bacterium]|nr:site-specific DNA-methyltransferase [bacterium]
MLELLRGDCLRLMDTVEDGSVDMILSDPPRGTTACKWDSVIPLDKMWEQINRIIKPNAAIVIMGAQPYTTTLIASNIRMFKYSWVWDKFQVTNFLNSKRQPLRRTEDVCVFYSKQPTYNPQMKKGKSYHIKRTHTTEIYGRQRVNETVNEGTRLPDGIISIPQVRVKGGHPTQKPVALMEYLVKTYTNEDDTVIDFAAGSFTTAIACIKNNRRFIGMEIDKDYFNDGIGRVEEAVKEYVEHAVGVYNFNDGEVVFNDSREDKKH